MTYNGTVLLILCLGHAVGYMLFNMKNRETNEEGEELLLCHK
jgi:hypothetical protein